VRLLEVRISFLPVPPHLLTFFLDLRTLQLTVPVGFAGSFPHPSLSAGGLAVFFPPCPTGEWGLFSRQLCVRTSDQT